MRPTGVDENVVNWGFQTNNWPIIKLWPINTHPIPWRTISYIVNTTLHYNISCRVTSDCIWNFRTFDKLYMQEKCLHRSLWRTCSISPEHSLNITSLKHFSVYRYTSSQSSKFKLQHVSAWVPIMLQLDIWYMIYWFFHWSWLSTFYFEKRNNAQI